MEQMRRNVPLYIGEFSTIEDTPDAVKGMERYMRLLNSPGKGGGLPARNGCPSPPFRKRRAAHCPL